MKNRIFLTLAALLAVLGVRGQDLICRTDSTVVEARVTEITPDEIRYKRFSNPDGPVYVLPVSQVRSIRYPNGEQDVFNEYKVVIAASIASVEEQKPEADAKTYAVGDYYENGAVRGVVAEISDEGRHGLILSLDEVSLPWSTQPRPQMRPAGTTDTEDGRANMQAMERFIAANNLSWEQFPAFAWVRGHGEGWYLPAIDELLRICANYNGGTRSGLNRAARSRFNDAMRGHGGRRMDRLAYYLSSTERDAKSVICTHVDLEPPFVGDIAKNTRFLVRAVRRF